MLDVALTVNDGLWILCPPLLAAMVVALAGACLPKTWAHTLTIGAVGLSTYHAWGSLWSIIGGAEPLQAVLYEWGRSGNISFHMGLWLDGLSLWMAAVVSSISLAVHVYSVGYMRHDAGYQRFFGYISLFTFAMLLLVLSDNFLQLFIGWEGVGLVSYLLIGFWYHKPSAVSANLKAFLINRIGDIGLLLAIGGLMMTVGSLSFETIFAQANTLSSTALFWITLGLFVGAMGKSAQMPLHIWLPDSMEGPTPISALIHAATMVTAGIFMVVRCEALFSLAPQTLSIMAIIGASTAVLMGAVGLVQNDIKRIVAYSTLSQLGYMVAGLGLSAYAASFFHLTTHAFFKALLFLGAGAVITAMHHEQDIQKMGGLRRVLPWTYLCMLLASLSLMGVPGFSGFFSKDLIIEAAKHSDAWFAPGVYQALLIGVLLTTLYSLRLLWLVFHGQERGHVTHHEREIQDIGGQSVFWPLIILLVPSVFLGWCIMPSLQQHVLPGIPALLGPSSHDLMHHALLSPTTGLLLLGTGLIGLFYVVCPTLGVRLGRVFSPLIRVLKHGYGLDALYLKGLLPLVQALSKGCWQWIDVALIDRCLVCGWVKGVKGLYQLLKPWQNGQVAWYALSMMMGLVVALFGLTWMMG